MITILGLEAGLAGHASRQQLVAARIETAVQVGDEGDGLGGQDLLEAGLQGALDDDAGGQGESRGVRHEWSSDQVEAIIPRK